MNLNILYEDNDILVVNKPGGIVVFPEGKMTSEKTLIELLLEKYPELKNVGEAPRYGIVHRLDKDTSGILLVAKSTKSLIFLQKQFKNRKVEKKYITLVTGAVKEDIGTIHTLIGRAKSDTRKQKAYPLEGLTLQGLREAITGYKVIERFENYTLLEVQIKTGRKHQIRCHLAYIHHPIAGDTMYGFKDSPTPKGLQRQFLHAGYLKITLPARNVSHSDAGGPSGQIKEFKSDLPEDLQLIIKSLKIKMQN